MLAFSRTIKRVVHTNLRSYKHVVEVKVDGRRPENKLKEAFAYAKNDQNLTMPDLET
jgi:hypothetical protein